MQLINLGLILITGLNIALASLIWARNPKNKINISFAIAVFLVGTWALGMAMFREADSISAAWKWTWLNFGSGALILIPFFLFSIYFPYQKWKLKTWHKVLIILSVLIALLDVVIPGAWITSIYYSSSGIEYLVTNRWGLAYINIYILIYLGLTFYNFYIKYIESTGFTKRQLFYVMIATGIMAIFSFTFGTAVPLIIAGKGPHWLGPYSSIFMILLISYFIFKKE